jgi:uncharacterized protein
MQQLVSTFQQQISRVSTDFRRYLYDQIHWNNRLIGIVGSRGTGKTTLLLQYIKLNFPSYSSGVLYVSLDNLWFSNHTLLYLADEFHKEGGTALFLDEVHHYANWSVEIKNIYDSYPDMKIVFTGSSILEIFKGKADLSRRAITYHLYGLSFREFLMYEYGVNFEPFTFNDVIDNHLVLAGRVIEKVKPIVAFKEYLRYGYFPYFKEDKELYHFRLLNTLNTIVEVDLPAIERIDYYSVVKIKKLFAIVASIVPFTPNITQLSRDIETTRVSLLNYLYYLEKAQAIIMLGKESYGMKQMAKPDKIYLGNTNYTYALQGEQANVGSIRESFFTNQVMVNNKISYSNPFDFLVDDQYQIEVGGKSKSKKQISGLENGYIVVDSIEIGYNNQIPLWLFGFLY